MPLSKFIIYYVQKFKVDVHNTQLCKHSTFLNNTNVVDKLVKCMNIHMGPCPSQPVTLVHIYINEIPGSSPHYPLNMLPLEWWVCDNLCDRCSSFAKHIWASPILT